MVHVLGRLGPKLFFVFLIYIEGNFSPFLPKYNFNLALMFCVIPHNIYPHITNHQPYRNCQYVASMLIPFDHFGTYE